MIRQDIIKNPFQNPQNDLGLITEIQKGFEMKNMYVPKDKNEKDNPEIQNIIVQWRSGIVQGFRSREEADRYINHVCRKAAPDMDFFVSSDKIKR